MHCRTVVLAELDQELADPFLGDPAGAERGVQIAETLVRQAHVAQNQGQGGLVRHPALIELDRWDADAFLVDVRGQARIAAGRHAADIRPMGPDRREYHQLAVGEHGIQNRHVVQVGAAAIGVVQQDDIARLDIAVELLHGAAHRPRHGHDVTGMVVGLRDHLDGGVEQRA